MQTTQWQTEEYTEKHITSYETERLVLKEKNIKAVIVDDEDSYESPRQWQDNTTHFWVGENCRRNYSLGDQDQADIDDDEIEDVVTQENVVALPVYMYSHSGETISTTPFSCPWDSGQIGFIYVDRQEFFDFCGFFTDDEIREQLNGDIVELDFWVRGEIYGYIIENDEGEELDSCYGFYGLDHVKEEAEKSMEFFLKNS